MDALVSQQYTDIVIWGIGSGCGLAFFDERVASLLAPWCERGGKLFLNGEKLLASSMQKLFGKTWDLTGDYYRRTRHTINRACAAVDTAVSSALPSGYCVKACMLSGVPLSERLYAPDEGAVVMSPVGNLPGFGGTPIDADKCPFAVASHGAGRLIFFGDVNAESETIATILALL